MTDKEDKFQSLDLNFQESVTSAIRVSSKNKALQRQLKGHSDDEEVGITERVDQIVKEKHSEPTSASLSARKSVTQLDTSFVCFIVRGKMIRELTSDQEIQNCRIVFSKILSSKINVPEAYFDLGKFAVLSGKLEEGLESIEKALQLSPSNKHFALWKAILSLKAETYIATQKIFESILESDTYRIEALWGLMEIATVSQTSTEDPRYYASMIKNIDSYYGYLAWAHLYLLSAESDKTGVNAIKQLISSHPQRPESYIVLWNYYYKDLRDFLRAEDVAAEAFVRVTSVDESHYHTIICLMYAKSFFRNGKFDNCFELLQKKFADNPDQPVFMYQYGKLSIGFNQGAAASTLEECLRMCEFDRHPLIHYWLAKAYKGLGNHLKAFESVNQAKGKVNDSTKRREIEDTFQKMWNVYGNVRTIREKIQNGFDFNTLKDKCLGLREKEPVIADHLLAELYWANNERSQAIELLIILTQKSGNVLEPHFLLLKYLKEVQDWDRLENYAQALLYKCRSSEISTSTWLRAIVIYSKALAYRGLHPKAINLLQCVARIFYPCNNDLIPYTRTLKKATTIEEMMDAASSVVSGQSYNNMKRSDFDGMITRGFEGDIDIALHRLNSFFNFTSDPIFLYAITKICAQYSVLLADGMCAAYDFLAMLRFEMDLEYKEKMKIKTEYYLCIILKALRNCPADKIRDVQERLRDRRMFEKAERLNE